jgi:choline dehydrogenase-like flavoprotein
VDGQLLAAPMSVNVAFGGDRPRIERFPGICAMGEVLRPTSEGSVWITSADPDGALVVDPNFLTTDYDRKTGANVLRMMRNVFLESPIADRISHETAPGLDAQTDDELIEATLAGGSTGFHAMGTCAMGPDDADIVDDQVRVRGIDGLRVVDLSIFPTMVSGNTNAPVMAMASRAADLILEHESAHTAALPSGMQ